ncbi:hypothetical protein E4U43_008317 [Claviceps pusilla]|uniref:Peptidase M43 pregnancy-associated plasma-A domain-containing protein n=1 Tax=Claviceps pusilla TaxID=123648 RepID=A0A9P7NBB4_9HYPO|nr:hypothetical protein E4U43_008317 [Claviceps pusilla]
MTRKAIFLLASTIISMVLGVAVTNKGECGAPEPTEEHIAVAQEMARNESKISINNFAVLDKIHVPVYVHVVSANKKEYPKVGLRFPFIYVTLSVVTIRNAYSEAQNKQVRAMITTLNKNYENMGFQFSLRKTDYTVNIGWASGKDGLTMKKLLRKGNYRTLNLYYVNTVLQSSTGTITGMCQFPTTGGNSGKTLILDGCVIRRDAMNNGQTTTHEVGHWLGLFHTFQGGCTGSGDMVADTPACKQTWSCDEKTDTCPKLPGKDAVHNFMAYGNCRTQFTDGQAKRARSQYEFYRAKK